MFLLCVSVNRPPPPCQEWGPPVQSVKVWGPLVKVQVKVRGPPRSRSRSRSGGPPGQGLGGPPVNVQFKVWGGPWTLTWGGPQTLTCPPPPDLGQGAKRWGARAVCLLRSRRRTVLSIIFLSHFWICRLVMRTG